MFRCGRRWSVKNFHYIKPKQKVGHTKDLNKENVKINKLQTSLQNKRLEQSHTLTHIFL